MLALERRGWSFEIGSIHPPHTSLRHEHAARLQAPIYYAPPQEILKIHERRAKENGRWPVALVARHEQRYGAAGKAALRARNALYFAELFERHGVEHFHVHFANRAAQTALFVKAISGIPFSVTAHGQDFMVDLGSVELLREICAEAEFVAAETDYSVATAAGALPRCGGQNPSRLQRNGSREFSRACRLRCWQPNEPVRILSVGRLVEFKGFRYLIEACAELQRRGLRFPLRDRGRRSAARNARPRRSPRRSWQSASFFRARSRRRRFFSACARRIFLRCLRSSIGRARATFFPR